MQIHNTVAEVWESEEVCAKLNVRNCHCLELTFEGAEILVFGVGILKSLKRGETNQEVPEYCEETCRVLFRACAPVTADSKGRAAPGRGGKPSLRVFSLCDVSAHLFSVVMTKITDYLLRFCGGAGNKFSDLFSPLPQHRSARSIL